MFLAERKVSDSLKHVHKVKPMLKQFMTLYNYTNFQDFDERRKVQNELVKASFYLENIRGIFFKQKLGDHNLSFSIRLPQLLLKSSFKGNLRIKYTRIHLS